MSEIKISNISRRSFLKGLGISGFVLAAGMPLMAQADDQKYGADTMPGGTVDNPLVFIAIDEDGSVTILSHRSEMGQGVLTSLPMVVADEMEADWEQVKVIQAPGDEARFGNQNTDGSRSMRHFFTPMRRCGAAARLMLEKAAAAKWDVPLSEVKAVKHEVIHTTTARRLGYGELAKTALTLDVPPTSDLRLKDKSEYRYIGKEEVDLINGFEITTGKAVYGIDVQLPDMLYAVVARPPVYGGKVASVDDTEALKVPGVIKIVNLESPDIPSAFMALGGVGVIAKNTWAAIKGREALKITWEDGVNASYSSDSYRALLEERTKEPGKTIRDQGNVENALNEATTKLESLYYIPHLAQAPMEAPAATVQIKDAKAEAWACVQAPEAARGLLAGITGLPAEDVTINVTLLGGGFGRKAKPDFVGEAALLSKAMNGQPVKVTWTREDDLHNGYLHTVSVERLEAGLDQAGKAVAWRHRSASPSITALFGPDPKHQASFEQGMGLINVPFDIANLRVQTIEAEAHTRVGWFRSVANIPHAFAIQSFVAEMAHEAQKDHKDFLLELIGPARKIDPRSLNDHFNYTESPDLYPVDTGRMRNVIERATREAGWGRDMPKGKGLGLAVHYSFVTYVACVVEVEIDDYGFINIPRIDMAVDCGPAINPERVRSQMEGAAVFGVGNTLMSEISFKNGRVVQNNFDTYTVPRMDTAPRAINVYIEPTEDFNQPLGGVGEPGLPPIAPALANAIFAASGKRIRSLPITPSALKA